VKKANFCPFLLCFENLFITRGFCDIVFVVSFNVLMLVLVCLFYGVVLNFNTVGTCCCYGVCDLVLFIYIYIVFYIHYFVLLQPLWLHF